MKKCPVLVVFIVFFAVFLPFVSAQAADDLDSAFARAEKARKTAGDFEGDLYFPGEWEAAESQYASAKNVSVPGDAKNVSVPDASAKNVSVPGAGKVSVPDDAIRVYNEAADAFERLSRLVIPLYAQAREDEITAIRGYLITLGAKGSFPEYLMDAERTAMLAFTQYEAKDYYAARDTAAAALQKFNVLETAFNAWLLMEEIKERGFSAYDPDNFEQGWKILVAAMAAYKEGDLAGAREKAENSLSAYDLALSTAWASYAELHSLIAEGERLAALDMKTDIAAKDFFKIADSDNKAALDLLEAKQYEDAAKLFINAEAMFVIASMTALEKRRAAASAIRNANEKIQESDTIAKNAEMNIKGGLK